MGFPVFMTPMENSFRLLFCCCRKESAKILRRKHFPAQYNQERKDMTINFLTTQDYTQVGVSSIYDPDGKQFSFIILLLP